MRLYFERIDPENDKFVATVKGSSEELMYLLEWYNEFDWKLNKTKMQKATVEDIKRQVENARKKFENAKNKS